MVLESSPSPGNLKLNLKILNGSGSLVCNRAVVSSSESRWCHKRVKYEIETDVHLLERVEHERLLFRFFVVFAHVDVASSFPPYLVHDAALVDL